MQLSAIEVFLSNFRLSVSALLYKCTSDLDLNSSALASVGIFRQLQANTYQIFELDDEFGKVRSRFRLIVTSSTIDIFFETTKFSKILSKSTLFSKILSKFNINYETKHKFSKIFEKKGNFESIFENFVISKKVQW